MTLQQLEKFYKDCMRTGRLPDDGLCKLLKGQGIDMFRPTVEDVEDLNEEGKSAIFWGSDASDVECIISDDVCYAFTPLRQTIILLLIEMKRNPIK